jgi:cytochrome c-type biogenesis protein CcmF
MAPLVLLVPFGPLTRWQREQPSKPLAMLVPWAGLALGIGLAAFFLAPQGAWKTAAGLAGAAWVLAGTARFAWSRFAIKGSRFTAEMLGMTLAHVGIAVFLVGALLTEGLSMQRELALSPGQSVALAGREFRFDGVERRTGPNYIADHGTVQVLRDGRAINTMHPEKRSYASGGQVMTEAGIHAGLFGDVYVALGEPLGAADDPDRAAGDWAVRLHIKPFVRWIWLGAALMALGAFVTAVDRRFRAKPAATDTTRRHA